MPEPATMTASPPRTTQQTLNVRLNRVEGDLELRVQIEDGQVVDAWSCGTMYRGFEKMLRGRAALDGLVITPRVCGICNTAHLTAAAQALEAIVGCTPSPHAIRVRNVTLMVENIQSDIRQALLMYMPDFTNPAHGQQPLYTEAMQRYAPLCGEAVIEAIRESKRLIEIIAILGGQWPHSSHMVPGGVVTIPTATDLMQCRHLLAAFRTWYEQRVLGCSIERWREVSNAADLDAWLEESPAHRDANLGFFIRFARAIGLDQIGAGHSNFISFGGYDIPEGSRTTSLRDGSTQLFPAGHARGMAIFPFDQEKIAEDISHAWFADDVDARHPFEGRTEPYASGNEGQKYSWAKAPRYDGHPAETGPLAEALIACDPLILDCLAHQGSSALLRELARLVRPALLLPAIDTWLTEAANPGSFYTPCPQIPDGAGFGTAPAARGALGHWVKIRDQKIEQYQIITPTAWNGSPRDADGVRGPWEEALIGTPVPDPENPIAIGHVVRSFDPCLVCTVHTLSASGVVGRRVF